MHDAGSGSDCRRWGSGDPHRRLMHDAGSGSDCRRWRSGNPYRRRPMHNAGSRMGLRGCWCVDHDGRMPHHGRSGMGLRRRGRWRRAVRRWGRRGVHGRRRRRSCRGPRRRLVTRIDGSGRRRRSARPSPSSRDVYPLAVLVHSPGGVPHRTGLRRTSPPTSRPDPLCAAPLMVAIDPNVPRTGSGRPRGHHHRSRRRGRFDIDRGRRGDRVNGTGTQSHRRADNEKTEQSRCG